MIWTNLFSVQVQGDKTGGPDSVMVTNSMRAVIYVVAWKKHWMPIKLTSEKELK